MSIHDSFGLPEAVMDQAIARLVAEEPRDRAAGLLGLVSAYPEHQAALQALADALHGAGRVLAEVFAAPPTDELPRIEGYRVVRDLGEGAFGIVYLCEQYEPMHRQVAVKVLRPGAGDRSTLARFDAERQFLARLSHPAIAQIFDAGLLPDGRPWFVMEHVPGVPITTYCDRAQLSIEARLQVFARLCHGVQYAHEQGIVHRDLKPANILVVETDGEPQPKIIDFGIARVLQP
ncbi:MAG: serine/threonine-protein kinase, partial [Planctomycetota bacterium]